MSLGHPVTLFWMSLNHQVLLAWQQVRVGDGIECFNYRGTPMSIIMQIGSGFVHDNLSVVSVYNLLWQWQELQLQQ